MSIKVGQYVRDRYADNPWKVTEVQRKVDIHSDHDWITVSGVLSGQASNVGFFDYNLRVMSDEEVIQLLMEM